MRKTENMMSLLGGALLGAAAMYLLDPETGRKRRENIKEHAGDYLDSAGNVLHSGWDKISDRAGDMGAAIAGKAQEYGQHLSDMAQDYGSRLSEHARDMGSSAADRARDAGSDWSGRAKDAGSSLTDTINEWRDRGRKLWSKYSGKARDYASDKADYVSGKAQSYADAGSDYADNITDYGNRLWNQVRGLGSKLGTRAQDAADDARSRAGEQHASPVLPVTLTAVGCCAMGVGLMYLMDPQRGRARRAWLSDTITGLVRNTGQTFYRTGKDLGNRMTGSDSGRSQPGGSSYSEQLLDQVRSEISRVAPANHRIEVMTDVNGSVTLTGSVRPEDADRVIAVVEDVPGVILVINRLDVQSSQNTPGSGVQL
jgi:osmotically-inducible protein OsmY